LVTKIVTLMLLIGALFDTVATDALALVHKFVAIVLPRSRKRRSAAASARSVDVQIDSRPNGASQAKSGWTKSRRVAPGRS
jgi:hypothetical protein